MSGPFNRRRQARNDHSGQIAPMSQEELQADLDDMEREIAERESYANPELDAALPKGTLDRPAPSTSGILRDNAEQAAAIQHGGEVYRQREAERGAEADERDPERVKRREAYARGERFDIVEHDTPVAPVREGKTRKEFWVRSLDSLGDAKFFAAFPSREEAEQGIQREKQAMQDRWNSPKAKAERDLFAKLFGTKNPDEK